MKTTIFRANPSIIERILLDLHLDYMRKLSHFIRLHNLGMVPNLMKTDIKSLMKSNIKSDIKSDITSKTKSDINYVINMT